MIAALDEIPRASDPCDPSLDWRPVRDHLGIAAVGTPPGSKYRTYWALILAAPRPQLDRVGPVAIGPLR